MGRISRRDLMRMAVAVAVAVQDNCLARNVEVAKVQRILRKQEAYLG
jgi:hypothetical protein